VRAEGGVPWEVKVVGADIKWLVARKSCVVYQEGDGCWVQSGEADLEMEVMIVLGWLARKFHRYRSGLARPYLTFKVSTFTELKQA
jgi:hypothetical protein